jgi:hypothetical protein
MPHTLSDPQQVKRVEASTELLHILNELEVDSFDGVTTGDESWSQYRDESSAMFAKSPPDVKPRTKTGIGVKKTMFTIFFTGRKLLITVDLPEGQKYNRDYLISDILPELEREKMRYRWRKQSPAFHAHIDHSRRHGAAKMQATFDTKRLVRSPYGPYFRDLSPCYFWFFGLAKGEMKDRELHTVEDIDRCSMEIWNGLNFKDVQSAFLE